MSKKLNASTRTIDKIFFEYILIDYFLLKEKCRFLNDWVSISGELQKTYIEGADETHKYLRHKKGQQSQVLQIMGVTPA